ncbi:hypothetical protein HUO13_36615 [Saccharopolyspora erythraea]|uniref:hypothetical protein n=1 Tax=Saccharopolyspora erythraea TaxID=1836 RepID=UPI001BA4BCB1|nr:hypothetical protein [Saccharopolyspora erythraea]QUH05571.1 hypothetical protein HUO13_36615 [Saccharopolyspora erythraea]
MSGPDISFTATVRARTLRFHVDPDARVEFTGEVEGTSESARTGLPEPVRAEITYRDVRIDYRLLAATRDPS